MGVEIASWMEAFGNQTEEGCFERSEKAVEERQKAERDEVQNVVSVAHPLGNPL